MTTAKKTKQKTSGRRGASTTNVVVLGGGLIGSVIASDLAASRGMRVMVADADAAAAQDLRCQIPGTLFGNEVNSLIWI